MSARILDRGKRVELHLPLDLSGQDPSGAPFAETTHTRNISGGGVCFETRESLVVGTRVTLRIQIPEPLQRHFGGRAVYQARAVLCRVEQPPGDRVAVVGARFLEQV